MQLIEHERINLVSGGNPLVIGAEALVIGTGVYAAPQMIYDGTVFLNGVGSSVGGWIFDVTHPNSTGQMVFGAEEFGYSYIAPAFPDSYFG